MQEFLTPNDAANICRQSGVEIGVARIRQLESEGKLPAIRTAGGCRLFRREDIERFIAARTAQGRVDG